jgi:undecaprenyl diphosphate synthase
MQHLAIIPDGNRRWAKANKMESFFGHRKGLDVVRTAIRACIKNGIRHLSFYTFSLENFRRSDLEKKYLFEMLAAEFRTAIPELVQEGIRVRFVGDSSYYPPVVSDTIQEVEAATAQGEKLNLNLLFCYGARQELVHAAKVIAQKVKDGILEIGSITEEALNASLWTSGTPDPDLIIRTGSAQSPRLSNYLLYQAAYSEWMFLDEYWPEVTEDTLQSCIEKFQNIQRNFGR